MPHARVEQHPQCFIPSTGKIRSSLHVTLIHHTKDLHPLKREMTQLLSFPYMTTNLKLPGAVIIAFFLFSIYVLSLSCALCRKRNHTIMMQTHTASTHTAHVHKHTYPFTHIGMHNEDIKSTYKLLRLLVARLRLLLTLHKEKAIRVQPCVRLYVGVYICVCVCCRCRG